MADNAAMGVPEIAYLYSFETPKVVLSWLSVCGKPALETPVASL